MSAKTIEKEPVVELSYVVYGSPEKVFEAMTQQAQIEEWCDGGGKVDPFIEGEMELFDGWVTGKVVRYNKIKRELSYTWKPSEWKKKTPASLVDFEFVKHEAGTEVKVKHSQLPDLAEAEKHRSGWIDHFFEPLNDYFTR